MKTKFLVSALMLSSCFVACTNEMDEFVNENVSKPASEVVGADLVSEGMTIKTNLDGIQSRANELGWEDGDPFGLAWYNIAYTVKANGDFSKFASIFDKQNYDQWADVVYDGFAIGKTPDARIYNNILFNYTNGAFTTKANVYQGAYIGYFPHQYMTEVAPLSFNVQQEQTDDALTEQYNKTLHISAQDFISTEDMKDANGVLESKFYLYPVANTLKVVATPVAKMMADELLKEMTITNVTVKQNQALFNVETGEINPWKVPAVQYDEDNDELVDEEATQLLMDEWAKTLGTEPVKSLSTNVSADLALSLAEERTVRLFTLPTAEVDGTNGSIEVNVVSNGIAVGKFIINKSDANAKNKEQIAKLNALTTEEGYTASDKGVYTLREIMRNAKGDAVAQNLRITLTAANFVPATSSIKTLAQWNELVDVINAMYAIDKNIAVPTFSLGADIEFVNGEIKVPACGVVVDTKTKKMIVASENVVWPNSIALKKDKDGKVTGKLAVEVKEGASLYVNGTKKAPATLAATEIVNKGDIYANAYASISTEEDMALNNAEGRVIVEFGSYVYPSQSDEGDIAFVVEEATKIANVNTLIDGGALGSANVNTLIVRTELDLNAPATKSTADDRYFEGNDATSLTDKIKDINIELEGGSLVHEIEGVNTAVANVKAVSGENTIDDVIVTGNIVVEEGATLNIEGITEPEDEAVEYTVTDVKNEGTLNVDVKILNVTNINNTNGGYIEVAEGYKVIYAGEFIQNSATYKGTIEELVVTPTDYTALEEAVSEAFNDWKNNWNVSGKPFSVSNVVTTIGKITEDEMQAGTKKKVPFYNALKAWFDAKVADGVLTDSFDSPAEVTADHIAVYQSMTGAKLSFEDEA